MMDDKIFEKLVDLTIARFEEADICADSSELVAQFEVYNKLVASSEEFLAFIGQELQESLLQYSEELEDSLEELLALETAELALEFSKQASWKRLIKAVRRYLKDLLLQ